MEIRSVAFRKREWESVFISEEYRYFCVEAHVVVEAVALFQKHHGLLNLTRNVRQGRGLALENAAADFPEEK